MLPFAPSPLVRPGFLSAVVTLNKFVLILCAAAAAVVVRRHPPTFEDAIDEHVGILRINLPEASLSRLVFLSGDLLETLVEGQVVTNRVLCWKQKQKGLI